MKKTYIFYLFSFIALFIGCSDFDEQEFTVLLPNAGEDQIVFTEETGTSIQLNGSGSSDVNEVGFDYLWEIIDFPTDATGVLSDETVANPILEVPADASGRYQLQLSTFIGDQIAQDIVNVDVNPALAEVLFVNGIDSDISAILSIPSVSIIGDPVESKSTENRYYEVDTNVSSIRTQEDIDAGTLDDGTTVINIEFNGNTITTTQTIEALKNYTLYLVGSVENPQILFTEKTLNQNTIEVGNVAIDAVNLSEGVNDFVLFVNIEPISPGGGVIPLDILLASRNVPQAIGALNYQENAEILLPTALVFPLPIWATVNGQRISNDTAISLPMNIDNNFGTFMLFPDAASENGNTLIFVNNSELLAQ